MARPRTPTQDKIARGNPGKRGLPHEPDPDYLDDLTPPAWMPDAAKAVWTEYAAKLRKAKVLTVIDVEPFARWCYKVAKWRATILELERVGVMVERVGREGERTITETAKTKAGDKTKSGDKAKAAPAMVVNQLVFVESMFFKQLLATEREFGMTPAARTRVVIEPQLTLFPNDGDDTERGRQDKGSGYFTGAPTH